jgi:HAD superfamily hydrolase (TIGR01509 family)
MIKGIIFDFDGTILDSESSTFQAWAEIYKRYNCTLPLDQWMKIIGTTEIYFDPVTYLEEKTKQKLDRNALIAEQAERDRSLLRETGILPGVMDYLISAKKLGLKLGIASSSSSEWVVGHLTERNLISYFDTIVTGEQVSKTKPFPYVFEKAVKDMQLFPYQVLAIEDSALGVTAAKAASIFTIAVPNKMTSNSHFGHADMVLPSLNSVSLEELLEQISA